MQLPNALYLGLPRCASTWLWTHLRDHDDVFVPAVKDIYFFDRHYDRGLRWYANLFADAGDQSVRIEFSHDYLFDPAAPRRIAADLDDPQFVIGLREPVSYLRSTMSNMERHAPTTAEVAAMTESGRLLGSALFDQFLAPWLQVFDRSAFCVYLYEDVVADPTAAYAHVVERLGLAPHDPGDLELPVNRSAAPRSRALASATKRGARLARRVGAEPVLGRVKANEHLRRLLYREADESPTPWSDDAVLRQFFRPSVERLSEQLDLDLVDAWGYA